MSVVRGRPARPVAYDSFTSITDVPVVSVAWEGDEVLVEFAVDLADEVAESVRKALEARDAGEITLRTRLETAAAALGGPAGGQSTAEQLLVLRAALADLICFVLGTGDPA